MPEAERRSLHSLTVRPDQPLIGVLIEEDDHVIVRYFADEGEADEASTPPAIQRALALAGAWRDMDWATALKDLDRIRHESEPTPPIDL